MKSKRNIFLSGFILLITSMALFAQKKCDIKDSPYYDNLNIIDTKDVLCLSKASDKKSLFWTFGIWCEPCRLHYANALSFAKEHQLDFYVILIENHAENNRRISAALSFLRQNNPEVKILLLDNEYGNRASKKNKNFLSEITPAQFENIDDMSKYILINQKGEVEMVTNYKDFENDDWQDDSGMLRRKLLPLVRNDIK